MSLIPGLKPGSIAFDPVNNLIIAGLQNAMNTDAAAFMPGVCEKISMERPRKNEDINNIHPGVSKGSHKINNTYR
jgi:hypothetical protein